MPDEKASFSCLYSSQPCLLISDLLSRCRLQSYVPKCLGPSQAQGTTTAAINDGGLTTRSATRYLRLDLAKFLQGVARHANMHFTT